ncbi:hypothetical protein FBULB1_10635 [Fusarium bulbicola]|nr:hypothetical protein FBULB1_10635 [Fusarium bulbicola]
MSLPAFHYFLALPLELRQEIYSLATPPRFVEVRRFTEQNYDEFAEHIRTRPNAIRLDESLTHFSFNWRSQIPSRAKQRKLERYGFSSTKSPYQPWNVSKLAPQISLDWLSENPGYAWKLCYRLAFRTRSHGPRTWFNFETDALFISQGDDWGTKHRVLSGCAWDIGQFHPIDMQKLKRIALDNSTGSLYLSHPSFSERNYKLSDLSSVLRLFQHLKELLLVEWTDLYMDEIRPWNTSTAKGQKRHSYDTQYLWSYQPVSEVDASLQMFPPKDYSNTLVVTCIGPYGELLMHHNTLQRNEYFEIVQNSLQDKLVKSRNSVVSRHKPDVDLWWEVPKVTAVHVMSNWGYEHLGRAREGALSRAYELRQKWLAEETRRYNPLTHGQVDDFEADEEAFNLVLEEEDQFEAQKTWWIRQGIIPFLDE